MKYKKIGIPTVLGWSMGGYVAQKIALNYPSKVDNLIIYASDCSGKDAISRNSTVIEAGRNTTGTPLEQGEKLLCKQWLKANPDVSNYIPIPTTTDLSIYDRKTQDTIYTWTAPITCPNIYIKVNPEPNKIFINFSMAVERLL